MKKKIKYSEYLDENSEHSDRILMKTRKSIKKRFKITKTGKILRRPTGQNHSRAKKSGRRIRMSRKWIRVSKTEVKKIRRLLYS